MSTLKYVGPEGSDTTLISEQLLRQRIQDVTQSQIDEVITRHLSDKITETEVENVIYGVEGVREGKIPKATLATLRRDYVNIPTHLNTPSGILGLDAGRVPRGSLPRLNGGAPWKFVDLNQESTSDRQHFGLWHFAESPDFGEGPYAVILTGSVHIDGTRAASVWLVNIDDQGTESWVAKGSRTSFRDGNVTLTPTGRLLRKVGRLQLVTFWDDKGEERPAPTLSSVYLGVWIVPANERNIGSSRKLSLNSAPIELSGLGDAIIEEGVVVDNWQDFTPDDALEIIGSIGGLIGAIDGAIGGGSSN